MRHKTIEDTMPPATFKKDFSLVSVLRRIAGDFDVEIRLNVSERFSRAVLKSKTTLSGSLNRRLEKLKSQYPFNYISPTDGEILITTSTATSGR